MEVDHNPVPVAAQLVRECGVGIQYGELPQTTLGMQDWKPCFTAWIEAPWRNLLERFRFRLFSIFTVHVEQDKGDAKTPPAKKKQ